MVTPTPDLRPLKDLPRSRERKKREYSTHSSEKKAMSWIKRCRFFAEANKFTLSDHGVSWFSKHQNGIPSIGRARSLHCLQLQRGWLPAENDGLWAADVDSQQRLILGSNMLFKYRLSPRSSLWLKHGRMSASRGYAHGVENDPHLSRDFLAQLWIAERKLEKTRKKSRRNGCYGNMAHNRHRWFLNPTGRQFSDGTWTEERSYDHGETVLKQPPPSQSVSGFLKPSSPEEALVAPLLARSNLLITRDIEWANLVLGFEQENRYAVVDVCYPQAPVGFIREQSNVIARQLLRLRRPFVAYITDAMGNELFRVWRPFWWITSSIYAEIGGKEVGVVHRRWHLWRRIYDLYLGNKQFAVVENPGLWNWTFTLKDINGEVLAQIDRDWRGFGFEILTDAGQYVIRFGSSDPRSKSGRAALIQDLEVARPLTLSERAVAVALAISLDNDYFSRHSGWGIPFVAVGE